MKSIVLFLLCAGCGGGYDSGGTYETSSVEDDCTPGSTLTYNFSNHDAISWDKADAWINGSPFINVWKAQEIAFAGSTMQVSINPCSSNCLGQSYQAGEYRSKVTHAYGKYTVTMKAVKKNGVVSAFFTYTGASDGTEWHEIDIEFLGSDTTKMHTNYFVKGVQNELMVNLGFDASTAFHTYAVEWKPHSLTWTIEDSGQAVVVLRQVSAASSTNIPYIAGKMMMNVWPASGWSATGVFDGSTGLPVQGEYEQVTFTPYSCQ